MFRCVERSCCASVYADIVVCVCQTGLKKLLTYLLNRDDEKFKGRIYGPQVSSLKYFATFICQPNSVVVFRYLEAKK